MVSILYSNNSKLWLIVQKFFHGFHSLNSGNKYTVDNWNNRWCFSQKHCSIAIATSPLCFTRSSFSYLTFAVIRCAWNCKREAHSGNMTQVENKANFNGKNCQKKLEYLKLSTFYKNIEGQLLSRSSTCYLVFNTLVEIIEKVIQL